MANKLTRKKRNSKNNKDTKIMYVKHKKSKHRRIKVTKKKRNKKSKKKAKGKSAATDKQIAELQQKIGIEKPKTKTKLKEFLKSLNLVQSITNHRSVTQIIDIIINQPHLLTLARDPEARASKFMGRLTTMQKDALIDYLNKHFEKPGKKQKKFDDILDKEAKERIWGYKVTDNTSALSDNKIGKGKGVGDHIYGIREQVCSKHIVGSNSKWNLIPCPHAENVAWKKVMITLTKTDRLAFKNNTKGFETPDGRNLADELKLEQIPNTTSYIGPIKNMIGEFNDIFLKLIKIKLGMIEELNNDKIPKLTEDNEKIISEYMEGIIKYDDDKIGLHAAHENFMKFYNWKKYCENREAKMFWTEQDGAGKKLDDALTKLIYEPLLAIDKSIGELTPEKLQISPESSSSCSIIPEESGDKLMGEAEEGEAEEGEESEEGEAMDEGF